MTNHIFTKPFLPFLVVFSILVCFGQAFIIPTTPYCSTLHRQDGGLVYSFSFSPRESDSVSLSAKQKRRRRKKKPTPSNTEQDTPEISSIPPPVLGNTNELPEFELEGGEDAEGAEKVPRREINPEEITSNMMGSGRRSSRTLNDLISDRSLEAMFEFEEKEDPTIPDFVDLASASSTTPTYSPENTASTPVMGKKKQRQADRVARAIAAKEAEKADRSFTEKFFPPQVLDENGDFAGTRLLEQGAWAGIFLLVAWEVYINSPFFERAAPLAPVVFEIVM